MGPLEGYGLASDGPVAESAGTGMRPEPGGVCRGSGRWAASHAEARPARPCRAPPPSPALCQDPRRRLYLCGVDFAKNVMR